MARVDFVKEKDLWDRVIANYGPVVQAIIEKTVKDAYSQSVINAPVRRPDVEKSTGVLGGSLRKSGTMSIGVREGEIRFSMYYAGYVHEGTIYMPPRPFLKNAVDQVLPNMMAAFALLERRLLSG